MSIVEPGSSGPNLVTRVRNLLLQPGAAWDEIDQEQTTVGELYRRYVIPLALIGPIASFIGLTVFGAGVGIPGFGVSVRFSPVWLVGQAVVSFALSLAMVYVMALVIDALAPSFGAVKDRMQAFKVAAYAPTAAWVAGIFGILPALGIVVLLGAIYSLFLLYWGLPKLMKAPQERSGAYFGVVLVAAIVINIVVMMIAGSVLSLGGAATRLGSPAAVSGSVNIPGAGSVDLADLEKAGKAAEAAARQMQSGEGPPPTDPEVLQGYLPANVGGFTRNEVSASTGGIGGMQGSGAEGRYTRGDARLTLQVVDLGAAGALAGLAGNIKSSTKSGTSYEKIGKVDGRFTQEKYDTASRSGEYGVLVGDRFMVQADGSGVSMDELKAAVNAVGVGRLEALAKAR